MNDFQYKFGKIYVFYLLGMCFQNKQNMFWRELFYRIYLKVKLFLECVRYQKCRSPCIVGVCSKSYYLLVIYWINIEFKFKLYFDGLILDS